MWESCKFKCQFSEAKREKSTARVMHTKSLNLTVNHKNTSCYCVVCSGPRFRPQNVGALYYTVPRSIRTKTLGDAENEFFNFCHRREFLFKFKLKLSFFFLFFHLSGVFDEILV